VTSNSTLDTVKKDLVISMDYELKVENEVVDYSEENDPIVFIQGYGNIIPGLEKAIEGMKVGDSKEVFVKAAEGYGEYDADAFVEIPKAEFPADVPMEVGIELSVNDEDGEESAAFIEEVSVDTITLNFNHPLAGKDLNFKIKIVGIREATSEELEHGHVHHGEGCCDDGCCEEGCCENDIEEE
jgi:FKBP-type peptidyl-prolyl cis-trans isomerase SlyD